MRNASEGGPLILVVQDVEETRDGIAKLLKTDGYRVDVAREENDAVVRAQHEHLHLILVNLGMPAAGIVNLLTLAS